MRAYNSGTIQGGTGVVDGSAIEVQGGSAVIYNAEQGLIQGGSVAAVLSSSAEGVEVFNLGSITSSTKAVSFANPSPTSANTVTLMEGSSTVGALEFNSLTTGDTLVFSGLQNSSFNNVVTGLRFVRAEEGATVTMNSSTPYVFGNGKVTVDATSKLTISGVIANQSGPTVTTSLIKDGSGLLSLSGTNTYSGGTTIQDGTLWAKSPQALGTGNVQLDGGKLLVSSRQEAGMTSNLSIAGNVNWTNGRIAFYDTGTSPGTDDIAIQVSGAFAVSPGQRIFDFSGVEALDAGAYKLVEAGSVADSGIGNYAAAHGEFTTLDGVFSKVGNSIVYTVSSAASGGPNIQNNGGANTPVVADYTVSVPTRTINASNQVKSLTFTGSAPLAIQSNGQLTATSGMVTVQGGSSVVTGGAFNTPTDLEKQGTGELDLRVNTTVNGDANVNGGLLSVNGTFRADSVMVAPNAVLGGTGRIVAPTVTVRGTYAPGNSPGTQIIVGNLNLSGAKSTVIEIENPKTFDRIVVSGRASLGGALNVVKVGGGRISGRYDFLQASGGIKGQFSALNPPPSSRMRFMNSGTVATLLFGPDTYTIFALTENQRRVAAALDAFPLADKGDRFDLALELDSLAETQYPGAFEAILPSVYGSLPTLAFNQSNALNTALLQRLWLQRSAADAAALPAPSDPGLKGGSKTVVEPETGKWSLFTDGNGIFSTTNSAGVLQDYRSQGGGVSVGGTYQWTDRLATGVYTGYQGLKADFDQRGRLSDDAVRFGGFGSLALGNWYVNGLVGGAWHDYDIDRGIAFGSVDRKTSGRTDAGELDLALSVGRNFHVGNFTYGVNTGFQYTYLGVQGFQERGAGALDLKVGDYDSSSLLYSLGGQVAYRWKFGSQCAVTPSLSASWQHEFMQDPYSIGASFDAGGPTSAFTFRSSRPQQDYLVGGAALGFELGTKWNAMVSWNVVSGGSDLVSQNVYLSLGMKF